VLGRDLGILPEAMINPLVTTAIASIILNPILYRKVPAIEGFLVKRRWLWNLLNPESRPQ
jgi:predicted Kef-type K+ transport protein